MGKQWSPLAVDRRSSGERSGRSVLGGRAASASFAIASVKFALHVHRRRNWDRVTSCRAGSCRIVARLSAGERQEHQCSAPARRIGREDAGGSCVRPAYHADRAIAFHISCLDSRRVIDAALAELAHQFVLRQKLAAKVAMDDMAVVDQAYRKEGLVAFMRQL